MPMTVDELYKKTKANKDFKKFNADELRRRIIRREKSLIFRLKRLFLLLAKKSQQLLKPKPSYESLSLDVISELNYTISELLTFLDLLFAVKDNEVIRKSFKAVIDTTIQSSKIFIRDFKVLLGKIKNFIQILYNTLRSIFTTDSDLFVKSLVIILSVVMSSFLFKGKLVKGQEALVENKFTSPNISLIAKVVRVKALKFKKQMKKFIVKKIPGIVLVFSLRVLLYLYKYYKV